MLKIALGKHEPCTGAEPFIIGAIIAGTAGKIYMEGEALDSQEKALELKRKQAEAAASQDQIKRDDEMMRVQSAQIAEATAQGMALSSGTLGALEESSYNKFAKSSEIGKFNLESQSLAIDSRMAELESKYWADAFGTVVEAATSMKGMGKASGGGGGGGELPQPWGAESGKLPQPWGAESSGEHPYWGSWASKAPDKLDFLGNYMNDEEEGPFAKHLRSQGEK